jgi:hypothetical protein
MAGNGLFIPLQLAAAPMRVFPVTVEHALDVSVQGPHDADARVHQWPAVFGRHDQRLGRCLPFLQVLLSLRKFQDVIGRILQRDELASAGKRDRILEAPAPSFVGLQ